MRSYIIARSRGAIALGVIFTLGTAAVLFSDARHWSDLTTDHLISGLVLLGTIASGHMVWQQARLWRLFPAAGLAILFLGGTAYCVTTSAARNVENGVPKLLETLNLNDQRRKLETDISDAKGDLRRATDAVAKECSGGEGPLCLAKRKVQDRFDSHYWMLVGRLANMKPAQPTNAGLAHAAKVFAAMPFTGSDPEAIERALGLFLPFARALFLEVATIVFFGIGLGHKDEAKSAPATVPTTVVSNRQLLPNDLTTVREALKRAGGSVTNDELANLMGVTKGEASRRASVACENGLTTRKRCGRNVIISLRPET